MRRSGIVDLLIGLFMLALVGFIIYIYMYQPDLWRKFLHNLASAE